MDALTRRDALGAAALGVASGLAGCLGSGGGDSDGDGGGGGGASGDPRLDRVAVANGREDSVSLDLQLELDGEVVFWRDVDLPGVQSDDSSVRGPTFVPPDFPRERGEWRVRARVRDAVGSGGETYTTLFAAETTAESCLALGVNVRPDDVEVTYVATHDCEDAPASETTSDA